MNTSKVQTKSDSQVSDNTSVKVTGVKKSPGRPVNPNSARQHKLLNKTEGKRGRPVNTNSVRQQKLANMEARKNANGGVIKVGRPKMTEAQKAEEKAKREAAKV